ncbi:MAG: SIMPL domain-containing protein [Pseudonocardiales bacterium]|nr:SIMPL domain-containing protein [Pseudonocardiales bacterium]
MAGCSSGNEPVTSTGAGSTSLPGITTRGLGTVTRTPNAVTVVIGVQTRAQSAKGALDANTGKATALIDVLKSKGVAAADLQTSQLSVNPTSDSATGRITGYEVTNQVTAKLHDIGAAGGLIDAAGEAAGDAVRLQQLAFSIDDDSASRAQARADAVRQAQAHAKQMADAAAPVPIEPGAQELAVMVEVVYAIDQ